MAAQAWTTLRRDSCHNNLVIYLLCGRDGWHILSLWARSCRGSLEVFCWTRQKKRHSNIPSSGFFFLLHFSHVSLLPAFFSPKCHCDQPIMNNHFTFLLYCNSLLFQGCRIDICYADSLRKGHHNLLILDFSISLILISLSPFLNRNLSFCYCYMSV